MANRYRHSLRLSLLADVDGQGRPGVFLFRTMWREDAWWQCNAISYFFNKGSTVRNRMTTTTTTTTRTTGGMSCMLRRPARESRSARPSPLCACTRPGCPATSIGTALRGMSSRLVRRFAMLPVVRCTANHIDRHISHGHPMRSSSWCLSNARAESSVPCAELSAVRFVELFISGLPGCSLSLIHSRPQPPGSSVTLNLAAMCAASCFRRTRASAR
jgi:hypothetical protein